MAIILKTSNPDSLLADIQQAIKHLETETWSIDGQELITHTPPQWNNQAFFVGYSLPAEGKLQFGIILPKSPKVQPEPLKDTSDVYPHYHGRFIAMLFAHFSNRFTSLRVDTSPDVELDIINR
jgi:hypothetical protein